MALSLEKILEYFKMTQEEFSSMTDEEWKKRTDQCLNKLGDENPDKDALEFIATVALVTQADRKKRLENELVKEIVTKPTTLSMETPHTDQNKARTEEIEAAKNPPNAAVAQSGEAAFNYVIKGENKAEIQKNREELFKAYDTYMSPKISQLSAEDKEKYKPEIVTFKTWAELEKSPKLFADTKNNYKDMKFPLEMTILKFDSPDDGKAFMENQGKPYLTKPPAPKPAAEKKEDQKADDATQATVPTGPK